MIVAYKIDDYLFLKWKKFTDDKQGASVFTRDPRFYNPNLGSLKVTF